MQGKQNSSAVLMVIGMILMAVFSISQLIPSVRLSGISVFIGITFFFIVEAVEKPEKSKSGLRFKGFFSDIKQTGWILMVLPIITEFLNIIPGELLFHGEYAVHVLGRSSGYLAAQDLFVLIISLPIYAWGEEIAWRGFFLGKSMSRLPFWLCVVFSSALFAIGHVSDAAAGIVLYEIGWVFVDSMIFSVTFRKSGNCMVSTVTHLLGNVAGFMICFALA